MLALHAPVETYRPREVREDYNAQPTNYHVAWLHLLDARATLTVGSHSRQVWRGRFARLLRIRYNSHLMVSPLDRNSRLTAHLQLRVKPIVLAHEDHIYGC